MVEVAILVVGACLLIWWTQTAIDAAGDGCLWVAILIIVGGGMAMAAGGLALGGVT